VQRSCKPLFEIHANHRQDAFEHLESRDSQDRLSRHGRDLLPEA
jgi:hypothetical protein